MFTLPGSDEKFLVIFLWKLLYLIFEGIAFFCLVSTLSSEREKEWFAAFWATSIILLYGIYWFGQSGVICIAFICIGLYLNHHGGAKKWVGFFFALAVPFKLFPLLLLPFPFLMARGIREKSEVVIFTLVPLLGIYVPFVAHSNNLVFAIINSGFATDQVGGITWNWVLILGKLAQVAGYFALCWHASSSRDENPKILMRYVFIAFLLLLCTPRKIHYFVWLAPFSFLFLINNKPYRRIFSVIVVLLFFAVLSTKQTFFGLLAPLNSDFFMSFPGWMDITYRLIPSGNHVKFAVLIVFILMALTSVDQIFILYGKNSIFKSENIGNSKNPWRPKVPLWFPVMIISGVAGLLVFSLPQVYEPAKPYLFIRGDSQWYRPSKKDFDLLPGEALEQKAFLRTGELRRVGLNFLKPLKGPVKIEIYGENGGTKIPLYEKELNQEGKGPLMAVVTPRDIENKILFIKLTNTSLNEKLAIPLRTRSLRQKENSLALYSVDQGKTDLEEAVLPFFLIENPLFTQNRSTPAHEILNSARQEWGFMAVWLLLTTACFLNVLRNRKLCEET